MQKLIVSILIVVCGIAIFFRTSSAEFIWNDKEALSEIGTGSFSQEIASHWTSQEDEVYKPLPKTVWSLASLFGKNTGDVSPAALHRLSLITHIGSAILVFLILALILENYGAGFIGGMLFLAHPLQTEAVSYIAAYNYVLAGFFLFLAIYLYLSQASSKETWSSKPSSKKLWLATLAYLCAILSAPIAVVTPVFAYCLEKCLPKKSSFISSRSTGLVIPLWAIMAIPVAYLTIRSQETAALASQLPFWTKPIVALDTLSFYLSKMFAPILIGPDYGRSPTLIISKWWGFATWILPVLLVLAIAYWKGKARDWYATAFTLFAIALLPTLGLIYFEEQAISTVANRYAYLAVFGLAFAAAYTVSSPGRAWLPVAVALFLIGCGYQTWSNTIHWQNNTALWSHGLSVNPLSPIAHANMGREHREQGDWQKASFHYNKVLEVNTLDPEIYYYMGEVEREHGTPEKAVSYLEHALKLKPNYADAHLSLGRVHMGLKNYDQALSHFERAVALKPDNVLAQNNLGVLYVRKKAYAEAIPYLNKTIEIAAKDASANSEALTHTHALLGLALYHTGDKENAQSHLETALKGEKQNEDANLILAEIYFSQKKYPEARGQYEKVVKESGSDISVYTNLAIILADAKEYDKAGQYLNKALALNSQDANLYSLNGMVMFRLRKFKEATESFEKALQLNAQLADPYYFMGDMARWQGRESESIANYYRALKIDSGHADSHYRLGHYFMKKERFGDAVQHFQAALKTSPEDQRFLYNLRQAQKAAQSGSTTM